MSSKRLAIILPIVLTMAGLVCAAWQLGVTDDPVPDKQSPSPVSTMHEVWYLVRDGVAADDAAVTGTTKAWSGVARKKLMNGLNQVTLTFLAYGDGTGAGDPNAGTFTYEVYVGRRNSSLEFVCSGSVAVGEVEASCLPHDETGAALTTPADYKWAEGGASLVTSQDWDLPVYWTRVADNIGKISFDPLGCPYIHVRIATIASVTTIYPLLTGR